jgi:hypothetical protein
LYSLAALALLAPSISAQIIDIRLEGRAGAGLLGGNEAPTAVSGGGTGGEVSTGITFNTATNDLTILIGWGSGNGFTDLTGSATVGHIHGPTASASNASFFQAAGVLIGLDNLAGWNNSATNGGFNGTVNLTAGQATSLLEGRLYINIHSSQNPGGEIRGQLIAVPEPSTLILGASAVVAGVGGWYFRRCRTNRRSSYRRA